MPRTPKCHPSNDMTAYLADLQHRMLLPYPAINNALGVESSEVEVTSGIRNDGRGFLRFQVRKTTDILILVSPGGAHGVGGSVNGQALPSEWFAFEEESPGFHRGVQGKIVNYVADNFGGVIQYRVCTMTSSETFNSLEDLLAKYPAMGTTVTSTRVRKELQGQPHLKNLVGPMWDGRKGQVGTVRYDTQELYNHLSL